MVVAIIIRRVALSMVGWCESGCFVSVDGVILEKGFDLVCNFCCCVPVTAAAALCAQSPTDKCKAFFWQHGLDVAAYLHLRKPQKPTYLGTGNTLDEEYLWTAMHHGATADAAQSDIWEPWARITRSVTADQRQLSAGLQKANLSFQSTSSWLNMETGPQRESLRRRP